MGGGAWTNSSAIAAVIAGLDRNQDVLAGMGGELPQALETLRMAATIVTAAENERLAEATRMGGGNSSQSGDDSDNHAEELQAEGGTLPAEPEPVPAGGNNPPQAN